MQIDLQTEAITGSDIADVCIVGSGVAGLILADVLKRKGLRVDLLEAGGRYVDSRSQQYFRVVREGRPHSGVTEGRFRVFGGTSTRWGGQLLPFGEEVFRPRAGRESSEWPINAEEIYRYAGEVLRLVGVNELSFDSDLPRQVSRSSHILNIKDVRVRYSKWIPFSRRNFAQTLGKSLTSDANVRIFLHANVVSLEMDRAGKRVESLRCRTLEGREVRFRARVFVLAAGTIEVVRLLLCSQQGVVRGIGNANGQVGKYFHDHLSVIAGEIDVGSLRQWEHYFAPWWVGGVLHTARLEAHPDIVAERRWQDVMACFSFVTEGTGFEQFRQILKGRQCGRIPLRRFMSLASDIPTNLDLLRLLLAATLGRRRLLPHGARVGVRIDVEQVPRSSIQLASEYDAFGMPRVAVDWRVSQEEIQTIHEFCELLKKRWKPAWGDANWHDFREPDGCLSHTRDTFHMMGGARIGTNERNSVVGTDLRVHGVDNLYVASCAAYPCGGSSNPTFTLMCLCLRLAETLVNANQDTILIRSLNVA